MRLVGVLWRNVVESDGIGFGVSWDGSVAEKKLE
jgi:hypothetical protein